MQHRKMLSAGLIASLLSFAQTAHCYEANTSLVWNKLSNPSVNVKQQLDHGGNENLLQARNISLRDSGRSESSMYIKNSYFRYIGNIGFYVPFLALTLKPNDPASPVVFDDPTSFSLHIHHGSIVLSNQALEALLNGYVLQFTGTPLKEIKVEILPGTLVLSGQMFRGQWLPFSMKGGVKVQDGHLLVFTPQSVIVNGVDVTSALGAANVRLDELLKIKTPGVKLEGSSVLLDALNDFPPPKLFLKIKSATLEKDNLIIHVDDESKFSVVRPFAPSSSYIFIYGGDIKIMRTMPLNVSLQIDSTGPGNKLDFCLYRYREQLSRGSLTLTRKGEIHVFFPEPNCAY